MTPLMDLGNAGAVSGEAVQDAHIRSTTDVHGVNGSVVGTTQPTINSPALVGSQTYAATGNAAVPVKYAFGNAGTDPSWQVDADRVLLESSGICGLSFFTPNTQVAGIMFADPQSRAAGFLLYYHTSDTLGLAVGGSVQITLADGALSANVNNDIDLGVSTKYFKNLYTNIVTTSADSAHAHGINIGASGIINSSAAQRIQLPAVTSANFPQTNYMGAIYEVTDLAGGRSLVYTDGTNVRSILTSALTSGGT